MNDWIDFEGIQELLNKQKDIAILKAISGNTRSNHDIIQSKYNFNDIKGCNSGALFYKI